MHQLMASGRSRGRYPLVHRLALAVCPRQQARLAHNAITKGDPWVTAAVHVWHTAHPDGDIHHQQRSVIEIAAHRERTSHTGADPLGPTPDTADLRDPLAAITQTSFTSTSTASPLTL